MCGLNIDISTSGCALIFTNEIFCCLQTEELRCSCVFVHQYQWCSFYLSLSLFSQHPRRSVPHCITPSLPRCSRTVWNTFPDLVHLDGLSIYGSSRSLIQWKKSSFPLVSAFLVFTAALPRVIIKGRFKKAITEPQFVSLKS